MVDVVDRATRSRMMSGIKGKNTKPEILVRSILHANGFRFRLHVRELPGKPDIILPKWRTVVFVHGCFWHGHQCRLFKWPATNQDFWRKKIETNCHKDLQNKQQLTALGWRVIEIWECSLRGKPEQLARVGESLSASIRAQDTTP